jgi:hypothetical protein
VTVTTTLEVKTVWAVWGGAPVFQGEEKVTKEVAPGVTLKVVVPDAVPLDADTVAVKVSVPEDGTTVTVQPVNCSTPLALVVDEPGVQLPKEPVVSESATVAPGIAFP